MAAERPVLNGTWGDITENDRRMARPGHWGQTFWNIFQLCDTADFRMDTDGSAYPHKTLHIEHIKARHEIKRGSVGLRGG